MLPRLQEQSNNSRYKEEEEGRKREGGRRETEGAVSEEWVVNKGHRGGHKVTNVLSGRSHRAISWVIRFSQVVEEGGGSTRGGTVPGAVIIWTSGDESWLAGLWDRNLAHEDEILVGLSVSPHQTVGSSLKRERNLVPRACAAARLGKKSISSSNVRRGSEQEGSILQTNSHLTESACVLILTVEELDVHVLSSEFIALRKTNQVGSIERSCDSDISTGNGVRDSQVDVRQANDETAGNVTLLTWRGACGRERDR